MIPAFELILTHLRKRNLRASTVIDIKELDPVSWNIAHGEWLDAEVSNGSLITFDSGSTHYWVYEIDRFIGENEPIYEPVSG